MALKSKSLKKSLSEQAVENATATKGKPNDRTTLKEGKPSEHSRKHLDSEVPVVGVSIGTTLNMGDYESLRVDVWLTDKVQSKETTQQAYERVVSVVDETLQSIVNQYK